MGLISGDCMIGYWNTPNFDNGIEELERGLDKDEIRN